MLVTVVQRALNLDLDLDAALARVRQARAAASGAGAELLPTADLGASATFEHQSLRGEFGSVAAGSPGFKRDGHADMVRAVELGNRSLRRATPGRRRY